MPIGCPNGMFQLWELLVGDARGHWQCGWCAHDVEDSDTAAREGPMLRDGVLGANGPYQLRFITDLGENCGTELEQPADDERRWLELEGDQH
eukprot:2669940-Pyramimonas_sp.AAC.1